MQNEHVGNKNHLTFSFSIHKIPAPVGRMNKNTGSDSSHAIFNYYSQVLGF